MPTTEDQVKKNGVNISDFSMWQALAGDPTLVKVELRYFPLNAKPVFVTLTGTAIADLHAAIAVEAKTTATAILAVLVADDVVVDDDTIPTKPTTPTP